MITDDNYDDSPPMTVDELHKHAATLQLLLDLTYDALRAVTSKLSEASAEISDDDYLAEIAAVLKLADGTIAVANRTSNDIPAKLYRAMSGQRQAEAKRLLATP